MAVTERAIWRPQEGPQTEFCTRPEFEVLYGGAKGGGKSDVLLMEGLRQIGNPRYHAVLFRRTYPQLQELMDRAQQFFPAAGGRWNEQKHRWLFPTGARYDFRHMQTEEDRFDYQGHEIHYLAFDQLEQFTEEQYRYLLMQVRTSDPTIRTYVRASSNPGGIGHAWVKKRFMDGREPRKRYVQAFELPDGTTVERDSCFIPARIGDNKILLRANPGYLAELMRLPEPLRTAMLEGNYDIFEGQAFPEWRYDIHTCEPFTIPDTWLRFSATDWGFHDECATYWFAVSADSELFVYRERVETGVGAQETGAAIVELGSGERVSYNVVGADVDQQRSTEPTIGELLRRGGLAYRTTDMSPGSRLQGKQVVHDWLRVGEGPDGQPTARLRVFRNCTHLIRDLPALVYDPHRVEDVVHSDVYDALRYGLMSRPRPTRIERPKPGPGTLGHIRELARRERAREEALGWKG